MILSYLNEPSMVWAWFHYLRFFVPSVIGGLDRACGIFTYILAEKRYLGMFKINCSLSFSGLDLLLALPMLEM